MQKDQRSWLVASLCTLIVGSGYAYIHQSVTQRELSPDEKLAKSCFLKAAAGLTKVSITENPSWPQIGPDNRILKMEIGDRDKAFMVVDDSTVDDSAIKFLTKRFLNKSRPEEMKTKAEWEERVRLVMATVKSNLDTCMAKKPEAAAVKARFSRIWRAAAQQG